MTYDPVTYWTSRGENYAHESSASWDAEEPALTALLRSLRFENVLDLGCGYGRVAAQLRRINPDCTYTGLDVSPVLTATTKERFPDANVVTADLATWETICRWDLVIASSVLGHLRPEAVSTVIERMRTWAIRDIVVWDWDETGQRTNYQYAHDYRALMPSATRTPVGRLSIYHERIAWD